MVPRFAADLRVPVKLEAPVGVAITFDDGPHDEGTPAVLAILSRAGARATFFVIGEQVQRRPDMVRRILADGHEVALHGFRHRLQLRLSARAVREDLDRGRDALMRVTGVAPRWHRPPYGVYSAAGLAAARAMEMQPLLWSRWGRDWRKFTTPQRIARRVLADVAPGDVILLHDADFYSSRNSHQRTAAALEIIMNRLSELEIGTVLPV